MVETHCHCFDSCVTQTRSVTFGFWNRDLPTLQFFCITLSPNSNPILWYVHDVIKLSPTLHMCVVTNFACSTNFIKKSQHLLQEKINYACMSCHFQLFNIVSNVYEQTPGCVQDLRRWSYEIFSTFLHPESVSLDRCSL